MKTQFKAIAAMSANRMIGNGNRLPWHLPEDLRFFRETTAGGILIMGRKTYTSIGRPLPGRQTVVLTREAGLQIPGVRVINELQQINELSSTQTIWICGGAQIYQQLLPACSELFLTVLTADYPGDCSFPPFETLFHEPHIIRTTPDFQIRRYLARA